MAPSSAWEEINYRGRLLRNVPRLDDFVLPRDALMRRALESRFCWLVGPPKVGKTAVAHCIGYLHALSQHNQDLHSRVLAHEGSAGCARGLEQLLDGPPTKPQSIILEDIFGRSPT